MRTGVSGGQEPEVPVTSLVVVLWGGGLAWSSLTSPSCLPLLQPQDDYSVLFEDTVLSLENVPLRKAMEFTVCCSNSLIVYCQIILYHAGRI